MNTNTLQLPLPVTLGIRFGRALAHDSLASGLAVKWPGLTQPYDDKAKAEGLEPGTGEWETMIRHAKEAFWVALYDLGACDPSEEDSLRSA